MKYKTNLLCFFLLTTQTSTLPKVIAFAFIEANPEQQTKAELLDSPAL